MEPTKLTKKALNDFISWSTSRYNDWLGYGTKKQNVELVYQSLKAGHHIHDESKKVFTVECAGSVGENGSGRSWKTKQAGGTYTIDCERMTVKNENTNEVMHFLKL